MNCDLVLLVKLAAWDHNPFSFAQIHLGKIEPMEPSMVYLFG